MTNHGEAHVEVAHCSVFKERLKRRRIGDLDRSLQEFLAA
jgi:hypothetical protein